MAIHCIVLEKPLGEQPEGSDIQVDEDVATALIGAGIAREATEEDTAPEAPEEETEAEGEPLDNTEPEMASVARNIEATVTKATEVAVEKLAKKANRPSLNAGKFVAGSDFARTGGYKNLGDAIQGLCGKSRGDHEAARKHAKFVAAHTKATGMSIGAVGQGADLVPQEWASSLWALSFKDVPDLMGMMNRYEMRNQTMNIPSWVQQSATSAITASVTNEAQAITATVGTTATVQLSLVKAAALVNVSEELLTFNSYNLTNVLEQQVPARIRYTVNDGIVNGTNGQINLVSNAAAVVVARQQANAFSFADIVKMRSHLYDDFRSNAVWLVSPGSTPSLYEMAFPTNSASTQFPVFLPGGFGNSLEAAPLGRLLGYPIYELENVPALGSKGDLILAHLPSCAAGYVGSYGNVIADRTPYLYFNLLQDTFRFYFWFDTVDPMTVPYSRKDGTQASNIVVLSGSTSSGQ